MSKRFTTAELEALHADLWAECAEVEREDGPRNAALFWSRVVTAAQFCVRPHAFPPAPLDDVALSRADRDDHEHIADAFAQQLDAALHAAEQAPTDPVAAEQAHQAAAQYGAALENLTRAAAQLRADLFHHLERTVKP